MQTQFSLAQLADAAMAESERILRSCVHCGFCLATCPTYQVLGDERDSPRGRIYLIKDMFERDRPAPAAVVRHIDRCLSCLSCMTTCPSGVDYRRLVDHARTHIERTHRRPLPDRMMRSLLAAVLPRPGLFRAALLAGRLARPLSHTLPARLRRLAALAPARLPDPSPVDRPQVFPAAGPRRRRVALLSGCVQTVLAPEINEATIRLLTRHGIEVVVAAGSGCCGAVTHHLGQEAPARAAARANVIAWSRALADHGGAGLDAVVVNASGCGSVVKDYGALLREDRIWGEAAARIAALARDVSEVMAELGLQRPEPDPRPVPGPPAGLVVAYHAPCSLQHGQRIRREPLQLLEAAGFAVREVPDGHLCCGSAGTYSLLQPALATELRARKLAAIRSVKPDLIATGNIGCIDHLARGIAASEHSVSGVEAGGPPILHLVELLDWATGGPMPPALAARPPAQRVPPEPATGGTRCASAGC